MDYSKVKKDQLVLLAYTAKTGKDKGKLVYLTVSKVKGKVRGTRSKVRLNDLNMGLGYSPDTKRYEGCQVPGGWFHGKPMNMPKDMEPMEDWDVFHCGEMTPLLPIIKASAKKHKLIGKTSHNRVHLYRGIPQSIRGGCHIRHLSINTRDTSINGSMFQLVSLDKQKTSDWIHFSSSLEVEDVKKWMLEFKTKFLKK